MNKREALAALPLYEATLLANGRAASTVKQYSAYALRIIRLATVSNLTLCSGNFLPPRHQCAWKGRNGFYTWYRNGSWRFPPKRHILLTTMPYYRKWLTAAQGYSDGTVDLYVGRVRRMLQEAPDPFDPMTIKPGDVLTGKVLSGGLYTESWSGEGGFLTWYQMVRNPLERAAPKAAPKEKLPSKEEALGLTPMYQRWLHTRPRMAAHYDLFVENVRRLIRKAPDTDAPLDIPPSNGPRNCWDGEDGFLTWYQKVYHNEPKKTDAQARFPSREDALALIPLYRDWLQYDRPLPITVCIIRSNTVRQLIQTNPEPFSSENALGYSPDQILKIWYDPNGFLTWYQEVYDGKKPTKAPPIKTPSADLLRDALAARFKEQIKGIPYSAVDDLLIALCA